MFTNWLSTFSTTDWLALGIGVALGIVVVFALRSRQVWNNRQSFGYNVYTADRLRRRFGTWVLLAALICGAIGVLFVARMQVAGPVAQVTSQQTPGDPSLLDGMMLVIPRLGVETGLINARIVGQDWDISQLTDQVAHLEGTAYPGQPGNAALAGHITIPGAGWGPFRELETLQAGDEIAIRTKDSKVFTYRVTDTKKVDTNNVQIALPTGDTRLTLMTCATWDYSVNRYTQRVVVVATLVK